MKNCMLCLCLPCICSQLNQPTAHEPDATHTDADLERAVRAALEAAARKHEELWRENSATKAAAIRALDPAAIVASVKRGEGE